ncbi:hypothetical protein TNCV_4086551 [Trichonephila clavipes]|nr:hypothetical protein TNCV_4086551 [Trichonephila clavipes]
MEESKADKVTYKRQCSADNENDVNNASEMSKKQKVDSSQESSNSEEDGNSSVDDDCKSDYSSFSNAYDGECEYCGKKIIRKCVDADRQFSGCIWSDFAHYEEYCHKRMEDFGSDNSNLESEDDQTEFSN